MKHRFYALGGSLLLVAVLAQPGFAQLSSRPPAALVVPVAAAPATDTGPPTSLKPDPNCPSCPPPDPGPLKITVSGLNRVCAGDHLVLQASGGMGSYVWSPNVGLSTTSGSVVVAGPLVTTTYTVTSTDFNGATVTATKLVTVADNCCPTSQNVAYLVDVPGSLFNATTGSPFAGYAAGTRFHLTGASPIVFSGITFNPPMGSVLLMDGGKDLYVQSGATLNLAGVSITAACDDMWGRLWVRNTAAGLRTTYADGTAGSISNSPASTLPTLHNQLSHSLGGIDYEQAAGSNSGPYFQVAAVDFLHNEQSMAMHRVNTPNTALQYGNYVVGSVFDSNPDYFKSPKHFTAGNANYPHYARYHVWFTGNIGTEWNYNTFRNALFGLHSPNDGSIVVLDMGTPRFENIFLAGVNINTSNTSSLFASEDPSFIFPTAAALPTTPQFSDAIANDVLDQVGETRGIFLNGCQLLEIYGGHFQQNDDPYLDFSFSQRTKQVGIKASRVATLHNNFFSLLHTGIELHSVLYTNGTFFQAPLTTNTFTACRRAIEVHGSGTNRPSGTAAATADVALPIQCNTFDRGNGTRPGAAYGVYLDYDARVTFDPLTGTAQPQSNKFVTYGTSANTSARYFALYNGSAVATADVKYSTFNEFVIGTSSSGPFPITIGSLVYNVATPSAGPYQQGSVCGTGNPGLERTANLKSELEPSSPNPATESTTFQYQMSRSAATAELRIGRGTDGLELSRVKLAPGSSRHDLDLRGWLPGVYFVTLYVNEAPVQTRRLLVQ